MMLLWHVTRSHIQGQVGVVELLLGAKLRPLVGMLVLGMLVMWMLCPARVLLTLLTASAVYLCQGLGLQRGEFLLNNTTLVLLRFLKSHSKK